MPSNSRTSPRALAASRRQAEALHWRALGCQWAEVARRAGYASPGAAQDAAMAALARVPADDAETLRRIEAERLDLMWERTAEALEHADISVRLAGVRTGLAVCERRAKLWGLDAPARQRVDVITADVVDAEIARLEAELGRHAEPE